jgi:dynein heavy chain
LKVLNFSDSNFVQNLEFAVKFGKRVLIENIGQKVDLVVYPLIKKEFTVEAGQTSVSLYGHNVEVDSHFKLFILSEMKNPRFGPDISVLTT